MRGLRSWWKGGPPSAVRSSAIWDKCRRLVEPHLIRYGGADGRVTAAADITLMGQFRISATIVNLASCNANSAPAVRPFQICPHYDRWFDRRLRKPLHRASIA